MPNPGQMAVGAHLRTPEGQVHTLSMRLQGTGCNNQAELHAFVLALPWAVALGAQSLDLFTDSSIVMEHVSDVARSGAHARLKDLVEHARQLRRQHPALTVHWIPRHRNSDADALARAALGLVPKPARQAPTRK